MNKEILFNTINSFINESSLVFDYVNTDKLTEYTNSLKEDKQLNEFVDSFVNTLLPYEKCIKEIALSNKKIHKNDLLFMNKLVLFNGLLDLTVFNNENKNTKKTIIVYIHTIYVQCCLINNPISIEDMISQLELEQKIEDEPISKLSGNGLGNGLGNGFGNGTIFESLMTSPLMDIAKDMVQDFQSGDINPMTLLTSMLSGKSDPQLDIFVNKIKNTIDTKISDGEINIQELEANAKQVLLKVHNQTTDHT